MNSTHVYTEVRVCACLSVMTICPTRAKMKQITQESSYQAYGKTGRSIGQLRGFKGLLSQQEVGVTGMMVLSALRNGSSSSDCPVSFRAMTIPITVRDLKQSLDKQLFKSRY